MSGNDTAPVEDRGGAGNCHYAAIVSGGAPRHHRLTVTHERVGSYLEQFARRVLMDAINEATAGYWLRRAAQFEAARPQPGDHTGHATANDRASRDQRLASIAQACRARAMVATTTDWEAGA